MADIALDDFDYEKVFIRWRLRKSHLFEINEID
jgi:hypothetical protein